MTDLQHQASLHEQSVQSIARGDATAPRHRRRAPQRTLVINDYNFRAHDLAMAAARELCGPSQRIVIVNETEVLVVNR